MARKTTNLAKEADKQRSENDPTFLSISVDLQSVLQVPSGDGSLLYHCQKLCVYNFTIYESRLPNEACCFMWSEINGKGGSNEIGLALMQWICKLPQDMKEISRQIQVSYPSVMIIIALIRLMYVRGRGRQPLIKEVKKAYFNYLPISYKNKRNLLKLCKKEIIVKECHVWYESLPADQNIGDRTAEPAVEDEDVVAKSEYRG
ncbi:hypothetical protein QE152_g23633 [Popillia japonica]|uniref:Uncharacterized protein n=1 Tax=Popillia japonica TaxID=7064 RepID=A0AAW1KGS2_POPJA